MGYKTIKYALRVISLSIALNFIYSTSTYVISSEDNIQKRIFQQNQIFEGHTLTTAELKNQRYLLCYSKNPEKQKEEEFGIFELPEFNTKKGASFYGELIKEIEIDAGEDALAVEYGSEKDRELYMVDGFKPKKTRIKDGIEQKFSTGKMIYLTINRKIFDFNKLEIIKLKRHDPDLYQVKGFF